jgi:hypothetical protein
MIRKLLFSALAALILGLTSLGIGSGTASAEVVAEYWQPVTVSPGTPPGPTPIRDIRCPGETSPINLTGRAHYVWYTTAEGLLRMNIQAHLTGTDANGTEYIANIQRHMEHPAWPPSLVPYTETFTSNLISKGATVNAHIVITVETSGVTTVLACRG